MSSPQYKNSKHIVHRAKALRQSGSIVERILWRELRNSPEQKEIRFRYQHPFSLYVADFVCLAAKLVVEIDGSSHDNNPKQDRERQRYIEGLGFRVLRFSNDDVLDNVWAVAETIRNTARNLLNKESATPSPKSRAISTLPQGEGGPCLRQRLETPR